MPDETTPASGPGKRVDRLTGKTIAGRYVVERLIARGGMAAVYQAHQVQLNRKVAIKVLRPPPDTDESADFAERFRLEAETLAQLNHPNIVTVYDHGVFDSDQVFLTMEYVEGPRLTDLIRGGTLSAERTVRLLLQVCEALRYAHRRGVVHRDLKPSNLLITKTDDGEEHLKVVDFGLVKLTEGDVSVTTAGLILGSPHCMAPEQVRGHDVDARTDIYALGVLLFRCLTGEYPFHGPTSTATMIAHLNQPIPTFAETAPDRAFPAGLEAVTLRCLAKQPAERFDSMEEVHEALSLVIGVSHDGFRTVTRSQASLRAPAAQAEPRRGVTVGLVLGGLAAFAAVSLALCFGVWFAIAPLRPAAEPATLAPDSGAPLTTDPVRPSSPDSEDVPPAPAPAVEPAPTSEPPVDLPSSPLPSPEPAAPTDPKPKPKPKPKPEPQAEPEPEPEKIDIGKELAPDFDAW